MRRPLVLVALFGASAAFAGDGPPAEAWPSLSGSGLMTLADTATLPRGRFTIALALDNKDRDPLGVDTLDYSAAWTMGLASGLEAYGRHVFSRVVALPERPVLPPPPLDLIVAPGAVAPERPYYSLYFPTPYVNKRGTARLENFVSGDEVVGLKLRVLEPAGRRPGLAVGIEGKIPLTRSASDLQSGSGTGGVDVAGRLTGEWRIGGRALVATAGYTRTGAPAFGDRLLLAAPGGETRVVDLPLVLPDRLDVGVGLRQPLGRRAAAVAEAWTVFDVGARTPTVDATWPLDMLAGVQLRRGRGRSTLGLRYHGHGLPSGAVRRSPLAGLVDVTDVTPADLQAYLVSVGAGGAFGRLRDHGQRVLAPANGATALPAGARIIPPMFDIRSEHQVGFVVLFGWAF